MGAKGAQRSKGNKAPEGNFVHFALSLNPTLTLTPTPTLSLILHLHLPITLNLTLTLTRIEYWDRAGGGRNIV